MIERLAGTVAAKAEEGVVLDVGGVGFLVEVSALTQRDVPSVGEPVMLFTYLHVRDEALQLFGFSSEEERELFRAFLSVSKIGPKLALAALSLRRAPDLKKALAAGDAAVFAAVPGIGKKTAERLILELGEKMSDAEGVGVMAARGEQPLDKDSMALARAALIELGFNLAEADRLLSPLDAEQPPEELIRQALAGRA